MGSQSHHIVAQIGRLLLFHPVISFLVLLQFGCSDAEKADSVPPAHEEVEAESHREDRTSHHVAAAMDCVESGRIEEAIEHLRQVPMESGEIGLEAARRKADLQEAIGNISGAIETLSELGREFPDQYAARKKLAFLLAMVGERELANRELEQLALLTELSIEQTVLLSDFDRRHPRFTQMLEEAERKSPRDTMTMQGLAAESLLNGQFDLAIARARLVLKSRPDSAIAQSIIGECLLKTHPENISEWYAGLNSETRRATCVQFVLALWSDSTGSTEQAVSLLADCVRRNPRSYRYIFQLSDMVTRTETGNSEWLRTWAGDINSMRNDISSFLNSGLKEIDAIRRAIEMMEKYQRTPDALAWLQQLSRLDPDSTWAPAAIVSLMRKADEPAITERLNPWIRRSEFTPPARASERQDAVEIIPFRNDAIRCGIQFEYQIGRPSNSPDVRMFESTGGGIAVIDFDSDSYPDLFLTQGQQWPSGSLVPDGDTALADSLFRNVRGQSFSETTIDSGLTPEMHYGQGCAAGDINDDGFTDLYVANIGVNRILINNGDGTFSASEIADSWTSSCIIADIDGDGYSDLFDVNYLGGELALRQSCRQHGCSTSPFDGAPDAVHWGNGDLTFRSVLRNDEGTIGPGLGCIAFLDSAKTSSADTDTAQIRPLTLFIGNDGRADFLLNINGAKTAGMPSMDEQAFFRGLAVNSDGTPTSSMGIAAGDINEDSRLDFFVTNYSAESNSMYLQSEQGFFSDEIQSTSLRAPGIPHIGWGTQLCDFDNDTDLDVMVANGHVADFGDTNTEYRMPMQLFVHRGPMDFVQQPAADCGHYFEALHLARANALLDWNRDGAMDVAQTTIGEPFALLTNLVNSSNDYVRLKCISTRGARDGIGTTVRLTKGSDQFWLHSVSGGYQNSNESWFHYGLGDSGNGKFQTRIQWRNSPGVNFESLPVSESVVVIEGRMTPYTLPH
ncbi:MAG: VCBS repeat-containing protein [Planctomycetaceae bacterium]|nr:VCBS repeat-containing protein [Planctomycetaceae bacterium]